MDIFIQLPEWSERFQRIALDILGTPSSCSASITHILSMICPLCSNTDSKLFHKDKRRDYFQCQKCRLVFVPDSFILSAEDEKVEYDKHENNIHDQGYRKFLSRVFDPVNERIQTDAKGLDFGCGPGPALAEMFKENSFEMSIYDPFYANNPEVLNASYDFITSTEVIEHVKDPVQFLDQITKILKPGGTIGLMTKLVADQNAFKNWHYKNDQTHIRFYSRKTFKQIANTYKLSIEFIGNDVIILQKPKKRQICPKCQRPQDVCLCSEIAKIDNNSPICVLRHKSEKSHALNTVKLMELCLNDIHVFDGESFDNHKGFQQFLTKNADREILLLYPGENAITSTELAKSDTDYAFVILDGTWRKTRAILNSTKCINDLPFVMLPEGIESKYILRKGPEGGVSSLEATAILLSELESEEKYLPLYNCFNKMIQQQIDKMGEETFMKNYAKRIEDMPRETYHAW